MAGDISETLNGLIETLKDGKAGFETAAADVKDPDVKATFNQIAQERARLADELIAQVYVTGSSARNSGSAAGVMHRGWINLRAALGGGERAVLAEAERGEDAAVKEFKKAMNEPLPPGVADVVHRQYEQIQRDHNRIRELRDSWK
jgi:uncharacterized protein (TIGR02284 family)